MPKFRKKPVVIDAVQLTLDNHDAIAQWCHGRVRGVSLPPVERFVQIDTLEGEMVARAGDWVIKGVQGEFYPCKWSIFEATYESADEDGEKP